jgi:NAD(P)-dependent dehydrogenase (short-subunit alcohol dehydrogenase family)
MDPKPRRTALVTGGSGGIGLVIGRALVERGYDVVLVARREEALASAAKEIGARYIVADAAEPASFAAAVQACDSIDLLVHAAGILKGTFVRKERIEDFDEVIRANLRSTFVTVHESLPRMPVGSRIILVSSSAGSKPQRARSAYSASKAAVDAFALALAQEVARDGIQVHLLVPAPVETAMLDGVTFEMHALQAKDVSDAVLFLDSLDSRVVIPRIDLEAITEGPLAPQPVGGRKPVSNEKRA